MEKYALLIINMINEYVNGNKKCDNPKEIIGPIKETSSLFRENGFPVIYISDFESKNDCGEKIIDDLAPHEGDFIIKKRKYSGFYETELHEILIKNEIKNLVFSGLQTSLCVRHTAADAYYRDYKCIMLTNACCDVKKDLHLKSILYIRDYYGAKAVSTMNFPRLYLS
ncbi:MAG: putative hydrolase [Candidatus Methanofastidiosum methylothiophilum]|uniref:Putative hydrolase n=1 Tax=Candidatus Methanofastidiosum methylothiophilum TaxID=1705564 RepID=A0A150J2L2_9EURY|nr:MAG: putative hydrolase [Candidatus Methanofastidiosum methylthiophilus]KYC47205.1 MAG: putative hydrolase [Candidatus Methanofastidiosum methylthiophilus]KYC51452.1 MAG: putative hydrolase [Candidatus Methanofastidiosum methylthiophilus]